VRPIAFFTWRGQSFLERCVRRGLVLLMAVLRPFFYAVDRVMATRLVHTVLWGVSRDRMDLLGEEYFLYHLKPRLKSAGLQALKQVVDSGAEVVLVSQGLDHVMRPLAQHLGVKWLLANRLDLRDGIATGRLLSPVIRPRGLFARITGSDPNGRKDAAELGRNLALAPELLAQSVFAARREQRTLVHPVVIFDGLPQGEELSVRKAFAGKHVLLVGFTGFIGKVWLANTLTDLPEIGKIYLLIRRQKSNPAVRRFEKVVDESPVFDKLEEQYGAEFARFVAARIEVVEGDVTQPMLGLDPEVAERLQRSLDVVINSSGLTDFNPDLRDALAVNVDATALGETFYVPENRGPQAHLFKHGRIQEIGHCAQFFDRLVDEVETIGHLLSSGTARYRVAGVQRIEAHFKNSEILAHGVMQFPAEAAAFLVLSAKEVTGKFTEGKFGIAELALSVAPLGHFPLESFLGFAKCV